MADSEEKTEEQQEEATAAQETAEEPAAEPAPAPQEEPPAQEAPEPAPEPAPQPAPEPPKHEEKVEEIAQEPEQKDEPEQAEEQQTRRRSSGKRASIDSRAKEGSVNQDTFVPPDRRRSSVGSDRRSSITAGTRRLSASDRALARSASVARKSRFGGLSSKARIVLGSIVDIKTNAAEYYDKKTARYQNTYKLESDNPFNSEKVDKILREVMEEVLENLQYDPEKCASTAKFASKEIRSKVKQLEFDRYKLVCIVSIGEKNSQDVYATCRFLWDSEKDRYSFYSLENTHVYAIAYCFGLYYE